MSCQLFITHTSPEGEMARSVCICTHIAAGRRDLVAGLEAGWAVLRAYATEVRNGAVGHCEIGNPDVVVAIDDHCPGPGKAATRERRAGILRAIRPQQGDAAVTAFLLGHGPYQVIRGRLDPLDLHTCRHVDQV